MINVTLYTRPNCGLCDEAATELRALAGELQFDIDERDVDADIELFDLYTDIVPVVAIGDRVIAQAPIARGELRRALREQLEC